MSIVNVFARSFMISRGRHVLTLQALWMLSAFALRKRLGGFGAVREWVAESPVCERYDRDDLVQRAVRAVDVVSGYFPRDVRCLGRAATLTRLLRRHGLPAQMVIGARTQPFAAHAWVEYDNLVLGQHEEHRYYLVIDRLAPGQDS